MGVRAGLSTVVGKSVWVELTLSSPEILQHLQFVHLNGNLNILLTSDLLWSWGLWFSSIGNKGRVSWVTFRIITSVKVGVWASLKLSFYILHITLVTFCAYNWVYHAFKERLSTSVHRYPPFIRLFPFLPFLQQALSVTIWNRYQHYKQVSLKHTKTLTATNGWHCHSFFNHDLLLTSLTKEF